MHENNPFQNIKDYWGSYYSSITESAEKHLADFAGYSVYKDGKWYQSEGDVKKGKGISSDELWNRHGDEYKRHLDSRKGANEDKDSRQQESTRSEEVKYGGEQLDELSADLLKRYIVAAQKSKKGAKMRGREIQMSIGRNAPFGSPLRDPNTHAYWKAEEPAMREFGLAGRRQRGQNRAFELLARRGQSPFGERREGLFHKDSDRLLREHIRAEYEARGIYPTSREVQETFNTVMDLLEKTRASERDEILAKKHGTSGTEAGLKLTKQELRRRRAGNSPQDYGDPARTSREEGERQLAHRARRNKPNRDDTEELMKQGFSKKMLDLITTHSGR